MKASWHVVIASTAISVKRSLQEFAIEIFNLCSVHQDHQDTTKVEDVKDGTRPERLSTRRVRQEVLGGQAGL
jgi:hypothetical protein